MNYKLYNILRFASLAAKSYAICKVEQISWSHRNDLDFAKWGKLTSVCAKELHAFFGHHLDLDLLCQY